MKGCITSRLTISHIKLKKKLRQKKLSMRIHRNMRGENKARARWGFFCCSRYMNGAVCHVDWYHSVRVRRILKITRVHIKLWKSYNPTLFGNRYKISSFFFKKKMSLSQKANIAVFFGRNLSAVASPRKFNWKTSNLSHSDAATVRTKSVARLTKDATIR